MSVMVVPLLLLCIGLASADDSVYSCGGFIQSSGRTKADLSQIVVRLYTAEGNLKEETDAAPTNGYYMIPVYAKGHYKLKVHPPPGWEFRPAEVELKVDGLTDPCSKGDDINFVLAGFKVSGRLVNQGTDSGPKGFKVNLVDADSRAEVGKGVTGDGGVYAFSGVSPGTYSLVVDGGLACVGKASAAVVVRPGLQNAQPDIIVHGYQLQGKVEGASAAGTLVFLFAAPDARKASLSCSEELLDRVPKDLPKELKGWAAVCGAEAAGGKFAFPCVPSGEYQVLAVKSVVGGAAFEVEPRSAAVTVASEPVALKEPFKVLGFTVSGEVRLGPKGAAAAGAEVSVNGAPKATADKDGRFTLQRMSEGRCWGSR